MQLLFNISNINTQQMLYISVTGHLVVKSGINSKNIKCSNQAHQKFIKKMHGKAEKIYNFADNTIRQHLWRHNDNSRRVARILSGGVRLGSEDTNRGHAPPGKF